MQPFLSLWPCFLPWNPSFTIFGPPSSLTQYLCINYFLFPKIFIWPICFSLFIGVSEQMWFLQEYFLWPPHSRSCPCIHPLLSLLLSWLILFKALSLSEIISVIYLFSYYLFLPRKMLALWSRQSFTSTLASLGPTTVSNT